jgi:hypothetical protein
MNTKPKRKTLKVYHQYQYRPIAFLGRCLWGWIISLFLLIMFYQSTLPSMLTSVAPMGQALIISIAVNVVAPSYLATHEDGLEYRRIFKHLAVSWAELSHLTVVEEEGGEGGIFYERYLYLKDQNREPLNVGLIVPIQYKRSKIGCYIDVDFLLNTPFGEDLQKYAPQVIEEATCEAEHRAKAS